MLTEKATYSGTQYYKTLISLREVDGSAKVMPSSLDSIVPAFVGVLVVLEDSKPTFLSKSFIYLY